MLRHPFLPYKYGKTRATLTDARGVIAKPPLLLGGARSLSELPDYAFFTPAVLYLSGFFRDAVLVDFMTQVGHRVDFYHHRFDTPIFDGLLAADGDAAWNSVLWAVRRPYWDDLQSFLCSVTFVNPDKQLAAGIGYQELVVLDPLAADRHRIVTEASAKRVVGAFGVNGNKFVFAFEAGKPTISRPRVRRYAPPGDMGAFTSAYLAGRNASDARRDYQEPGQEGPEHDRQNRGMGIVRQKPQR